MNKHTFFQKGMSKNKTPEASLKRRTHGLGLPIHIKKVSILMNIGYYIIMVLNMLSYINYIKFPSGIAIFPSGGSQEPPKRHPGNTQGTPSTAS